ncbi:extensin-like domain-containing protein [Leisingera thetidis]|uniref:extensin-like domain-containing protein n=1 Tax=Leisingera thetidis TaxID=2930199 RepID=UPI0021F72316|nr:extensin family protein [Leisingera thetidis]
MIRAGALLAAVVFGGAAAAAAPETSLEPPARPSADAGIAAALAPAPDLRPASRPQSDQRLAAAARPADLPLLAPGASLHPSARPDSLAGQVLFKRRQRRKGSVCGDIDIQGDSVGHVSGTLAGCGARDAVRVREIAGVRLSQASLMTCNTARALKTWINREVETAFGRRNKVVSLRVAAHYACRPRNNRPGAKISEHGKARAIDISGFTLASGETITVLKGWQNRKTRKKLTKIWRAACGPFGTVLGPEADRHHRDHFHLDIARHRGGTYCR